MTTLFALATACMLLTVPVKDCDPVAQKWLPDVQRLPANHWAMLDLFIVDDGKDSAHTDWYSDGRTVMKLSPGAGLKSLEHELGHVVGRSMSLNSKPLDKAYRDKFWRNGKPLGRPTDYGKTNYHEDFADCYKQVMRHNVACDSQRRDFIVKYAFDGRTPAKVT